MWKDDEYVYSTGILLGIAENYETLYEDGFEFSVGKKQKQYKVGPYPFFIAEYKADFDTAFNSLSKKMQIFINYEKENLTDYEIEGKGYYDIDRYRKIAYRRMADYLNGVLR